MQVHLYNDDRLFIHTITTTLILVFTHIYNHITLNVFLICTMIVAANTVWGVPETVCGRSRSLTHNTFLELFPCWTGSNKMFYFSEIHCVCVWSEKGSLIASTWLLSSITGSDRSSSSWGLRLFLNFCAHKYNILAFSPKFSLRKILNNKIVHMIITFSRLEPFAVRTACTIPSGIQSTEVKAIIQPSTWAHAGYV